MKDAQSNVKWGGGSMGANGVNGGGHDPPPIVMPLPWRNMSVCTTCSYFECISTFLSSDVLICRRPLNY